MSPNEFLAALRDAHDDMLRAGLHGKCFRVYLLLKLVFPQAQPYWNIDHVITEIDGKFWDIRGRVLDTGEYEPMSISPHAYNNAHLWDTTVEAPKR